MNIKSVHIENFRCIERLDVELGDITVFIGPNNAGKTALLDAIRIALTRKWGQRGTGFTEYDVHLASDTDDPKTSPGIVIELRTEEDAPGEWPTEVHQALDELIQIDPVTGGGSITLRVSCSWNDASGAFEPTWAFLNAARLPLVAGSARRVNLERFWQYLPVFYLGALRDAEDEFSSRSQFWGRLLKAMEIPPQMEGRVQKVLDVLNRKLLRADPRLGQIAETLTGATQVAARDRDGKIDLRVMPLKSWDLLSKAEIILRNEPGWAWLPLRNQGQGIQSLSVIFLFQAFVQHLLAELYEAASSPVLALEEPETHLHPQAARTLLKQVSSLSGQKIITTHSPYFVQNVPFRDLRLLRLTANGTEVRWLKTKFSRKIPYVAVIDSIVNNSGGLLTYERATETLTVHGTLPEDIYRRLLTCYGTHTDRAVIQGVLRELKDESIVFVADDDLQFLQTFACRIRGEIFFATRWLIVEGQAEYLLIHATARHLGYDLDEHGVSVIDAVNNGNPAAFAALARGLGIPWIAVFDGDDAGQGYLRGISNRNFPREFVTDRCGTLPDGNLEEQLLSDGFEAELRSIFTEFGHADAAQISRDELRARMDKATMAYAAALAGRIASDANLAQRMPAAFRNAIMRLRGLQE